MKYQKIRLRSAPLKMYTKTLLKLSPFLKANFSPSPVGQILEVPTSEYPASSLRCSWRESIRILCI